MSNEEPSESTPLNYQQAPASTNGYQRLAIFSLRVAGLLLVTFTLIGAIDFALRAVVFNYSWRTDQLIGTAAYGTLGGIAIAFASRVGRWLGSGLDPE